MKRWIKLTIAVMIVLVITSCGIVNRPPLAPTNPVPADGETNQPVNLTLSWNCEEPDDDYPLTYDVYFGTSKNNLNKISNRQGDESVERNNLEYSTTYYWKVIPYDSKGKKRDLFDIKIWKFTTKYLPATERMVLVEGGTFQMGDTWGDGYSDERPVHEVTLTYDFYMGKYEVTFEEYDEYCEDTGESKPPDYGWGRGKHPVINVSWYDAIEYCNWLSEKEGLSKAYNNDGDLLDKYGNITTDITEVEGYRLPTEAEWEFAARGGNESNGYKYAGSNDPDEVAWYYDNSGGHTHEVGTKEPNELGIYDMSGNVYEWCQDWYDSDYYEISPKTNPYNHETGSYRVERGGSWGGDASYVRVAFRYFCNPVYADSYGGFRICRTVY